MKYKNCSKCGQANPMENKYCSECGTAFKNMVPSEILKRRNNQSDGDTLDSPTKNKRVYILLVLGIVLCAVSIYAFNGFTKGMHKERNNETQGKVISTIEESNFTAEQYDENETSETVATEPTVIETTGTPEEELDRTVPEYGMIAAGNYHSVYLYPNGTVFAVGSNRLSEYDNRETRLDVSEWTDIIAISASSHTVGLKSDGTVVACGVNRYGQCDLPGWTDIVAISAGDDHTVGLRRDGTVVAKGNNESGQCDVSHWKNIIDVAACKDTTFGLRADGTIIAAGKKNYGYTWRNIASICGGTYDLVGLRNDGTVVATGSSDSWDRNTLGNWRDIIDISASSTHIVGLKSDETVVACGKENAAEACNVNGWKDIVQVSAGMYFTIGLKSDGTVVSAGENSYGQCDLS